MIYTKMKLFSPTATEIPEKMPLIFSVTLTWSCGDDSETPMCPSSNILIVSSYFIKIVIYLFFLISLCKFDYTELHHLDFRKEL